MEKIVYKTKDDFELNGIFENSNNDTCVIMCHGIRASKEEHGNFTKLAEKLAKNNIDSFRFDFRGHGDNSSIFETVTINGEIIDLETTIQLVYNMGYKNIVLLGASFGAGTISLVNHKNIKGLILWYPCIVYEKTSIFFDENVEKAIKEGYIETKSLRTGKVFKFTKELMVETTVYKPYDKLIKSELPKIFIHGMDDKDVLCESTKNCAMQCPNSELMILEGGSHGFFTEPELFEKVLDETITWIKKLIK